MNRHAFLFDESRAIVNMLNYFPKIIQESPEIQKNLPILMEKAVLIYIMLESVLDRFCN